MNNLIGILCGILDIFVLGFITRFKSIDIIPKLIIGWILIQPIYWSTVILIFNFRGL